MANQVRLDTLKASFRLDSPEAIALAGPYADTAFAEALFSIEGVGRVWPGGPRSLTGPGVLVEWSGSDEAGMDAAAAAIEDEVDRFMSYARAGA